MKISSKNGGNSDFLRDTTKSGLETFLSDIFTFPLIFSFLRVVRPILIQTSFNTDVNVTYTNNITQVLNVTFNNASCPEVEQKLTKTSDVD